MTNNEEKSIERANTKMFETIKEWFEFDISIKFLGVEIIHFVYPKDN